jgi:prepilin-type N-terminal cleavage/methylation domain-containing protein
MHSQEKGEDDDKKDGLVRKSENGFTILESLVAVSVVGILTAVALPSLSNALTAHSLAAGLRETAGIIRVARSAAITRNQQARITVGNDHQTLTIEMAPTGSSTWTTAGDAVALDGGVSVSSISPGSRVTFDSKGTLGNVTNGVTVTLRSSSGATKQILVTLLGGVDVS